MLKKTSDCDHPLNYRKLHGDKIACLQCGLVKPMKVDPSANGVVECPYCKIAFSVE